MNINQLRLNRVCIQKASVITPPPPCASHVLYLIIYFPTVFGGFLYPNFNFDQIQNKAGFRSCSVWGSRAAGPQYGVLHRTQSFQRPHKLHAGKYVLLFFFFKFSCIPNVKCSSFLGAVYLLSSLFPCAHSPPRPHPLYLQLPARLHIHTDKVAELNNLKNVIMHIK